MPEGFRKIGNRTVGAKQCPQCDGAGYNKHTTKDHSKAKCYMGNDLQCDFCGGTGRVLMAEGVYKGTISGALFLESELPKAVVEDAA